MKAADRKKRQMLETLRDQFPRWREVVELGEEHGIKKDGDNGSYRLCNQIWKGGFVERRKEGRYTYYRWIPDEPTDIIEGPVLGGAGCFENQDFKVVLFQPHTSPTVWDTTKNIVRKPMVYQSIIAFACIILVGYHGFNWWQRNVSTRI